MIYLFRLGRRNIGMFLTETAIYTCSVWKTYSVDNRPYSSRALNCDLFKVEFIFSRNDSETTTNTIDSFSFEFSMSRTAISFIEGHVQKMSLFNVMEKSKQF